MLNDSGSHNIVAAAIIASGAVLATLILMGNQIDWNWVVAITVLAVVLSNRR